MVFNISFVLQHFISVNLHLYSTCDACIYYLWYDNYMDKFYLGLACDDTSNIQILFT